MWTHPPVADRHARCNGRVTALSACPVRGLAPNGTRSPYRHPNTTERTPRGNRLAGTLERGMARVLIVEDDNVIATSMARHLVAAGFDVGVVNDGRTAMSRLRFEHVDVCVLDLMLPEVDGWKVIETCRSEGMGTPFVVVSARGSEHDRVQTLEIGADDYISKPFSMRELVTRVRVAARRRGSPPVPDRGETITVGELRIEPRRVQAYVNDMDAELTPTEFRLLHALAIEPGRVFTRDELLQNIWNRRQTHRDRTVDVFVRRLRDKIDRRSERFTYVQTRYGVGYLLEAVERPA